ncbi:MAG: hypothetical protein GC204_13115 [Chloroflexi bacterium]|nr:hypothetical protein [Chloroflexota bacterium]
MIDPTSLVRLGQIRQQEILEQAAYDRQPRVPLIQWSRLLEPLHAFWQRRSRRRATYQPLTTLGQPVLDDCPCE